MFINRATNWHNAKTDCKRKGSRLAVADTHARLKDLADLRVSAGKKNKLSRL